MVLGRAGRLTPGGLRAAIARAVIDVAPDKARKRREEAARDARVQRWAEDSGNAALMGRELPPAEVLAADQRITAWARQLREAGLDGDMDVLRARAYLDLLLGKDSRPGQDTAAGQDTRQRPGRRQTRRPGRRRRRRRTAAAARRPRARAARRARRTPARTGPAGFAGRINLTIPLATLLGLADRPAEIGGIGPIDPNPGANTSDCYQSQERADPARAAHPPRPDLPHPPTPGPRCQARSKPAGAGNEGPGVRPLSTVLCRRASFPWHGILLNWLSEIGATVARQPGNDGHL